MLVKYQTMTADSPQVEITWIINNLVRDLEDGRVRKVMYSVLAEDGTYVASASGELEFDGEITIPFGELTSEDVMGWVQNRLSEEGVAQLEEALRTNLNIQRTPVQGTGCPWVATEM